MAVGRVTIRDVAREAGVSISTVSNALNNVDVLHPDTKKRVLEAARRLHYTPNLNGRNLKAQATGVIGLFLSSIRGPYYSVLSDSIYEVCKKRGYELEIFLSDDAGHIMTNLLGGRVDGAMILNNHVRDEQERQLRECEMPVVFIDREVKDRYLSSVVFDSRRGGEMAARFLLELGHKRFFHIEGVQHNFDSIERLAGFREVLKNAGIALAPENILPGEFEHDSAYRALTRRLEAGGELPDAIFASNDQSALGAIDALLDHGVRVPEDVSVIGCDDIATAKLSTPSLTTIRTSFEKQGAIAVEELIGLIDGAEGGVTRLSGRVIPRESTKAKEQEAEKSSGERNPGDLRGQDECNRL